MATPQLKATSDSNWFEWRDGPARQTKVLVRVVEAKDGRYHVTGLRIEGTVSAELLRSIPVGRIEAAANAQFHGGTVAGKRRPIKIPVKLRAGAAAG